MADALQFSRIYDLKSQGVDKVIADINKIIEGFEQLKQVKEEATSGKITIAPGGLEDFNKQIAGLAGNLDKIAAAADKSAAATENLADSIKIVTMNMQQSTQVMGANLTVSTVSLSKMQSGFEAQQRAIGNYEASIGKLGVRLAELKERAESTSQSLKILGEQYRENGISEDEYQEQNARLTTELQQYKTQITEVTAAMTALNKVYKPGLLAEENAELAENRVLLQQRNQLLKLATIAEMANEGSRDAARAQIALLQKELGSLNVVTDENIAKILKSNLATEEEIARQKELIDTLDTLHEFVRENSDSYTKQKINIGNYPQLKTEFAGLQQQMVELILAGKKDSALFKELEADALKLAASMKEVNAAMAQVNAATKEQATVGDKFISIVERMGLRMLANIIIFQVAIEVFTYLWQKITNTDEAGKKMAEDLERQQKALISIAEETNKAKDEEISKTKTLIAEMTNLNNSYDSRIEAMKQLNELYPGLLDNMTQEEALAGNISSQNEKMNKVNELRTQIKNMELSIEEKRRELPDKEKAYQKAIEDNPIDHIFEFENEKSKENIQKALNPINDLKAEIEGLSQEVIRANLALNNLLHPKHEGKWLDDLRKQRDELEKELGTTDYKDVNNINPVYLAKQKQIEELNKEIKKLEPKKDKRAKEPHDYLDQELAAKKKLYDEEAKLEEAKINLEQIGLKEITDNDTYTLDERLAAYKIYTENRKSLTELAKQAEIKSDEDKLKKIQEIETALEKHKNKQPLSKTEKQYFDDRGQLKPQEKNLLLNKEEIQKQIEADLQIIQTAIRQINSEAINETEAIVKSSFAALIGNIVDQLTDVKTKIRTEFNAKEENVLNSSKSPENKQEKLDKLENKEKMAEDQQEIIADGLKVQEIQTELQNAELMQQGVHDDKMVALEKKLNQELLAAKEDLIAKKKDLNTRELTDEEKAKKIKDALVEGSAQIAQTFANQYIALQEKQDAYRDAMAKRSLAWNEKLENSEIESNNQRLTEQKANMLAEQQLEKQKAEADRKRAEEEIIINAVIAASKAIALNPPPSPIGLISAGEVMAQATIQEAFLAKAPAYAEGTSSHPGGYAWVGDGGEPELIKIANQYMISPSKPTLTNLPAGAQVTPFSQIQNAGGNLGANLHAPRFNSSSSTANPQEILHATSNLMNSVSDLHNSVMSMHDKMNNIKVSLNTDHLQKTIKTEFYKKPKF